jgi:hypothetical protein
MMLAKDPKSGSMRTPVQRGRRLMSLAMPYGECGYCEELSICYIVGMFIAQEPRDAIAAIAKK